MARPRKPTATLELTGQFRKNPSRGRARANEPKPSGPLGRPPLTLRDEEKSAWMEIASLIPPQVATNADRLVVEHLSRLVARMRSDGLGGRYGLSVGEQSLMLQLCVRLGMTPADRSKISVQKSDEESNPFSELAADGQSQKPN